VTITLIVTITVTEVFGGCSVEQVIGKTGVDVGVSGVKFFMVLLDQRWAMDGCMGCLENDLKLRRN
jgi:hypothetical protein